MGGQTPARRRRGARCVSSAARRSAGSWPGARFALASLSAQGSERTVAKPMPRTPSCSAHSPPPGLVPRHTSGWVRPHLAVLGAACPLDGLGARPRGGGCRVQLARVQGAEGGLGQRPENCVHVGLVHGRILRGRRARRLRGAAARGSRRGSRRRLRLRLRRAALGNLGHGRARRRASAHAHAAPKAREAMRGAKRGGRALRRLPHRALLRCCEKDCCWMGRHKKKN